MLLLLQSFLCQNEFNYASVSRKLYFYRTTTCNATHGIAMKKAVCPSVCPSIRTKLVPIFLYCMKDNSSQFSDKKNGWWGDPFDHKFWGKLALLERKRRFSINIHS